MLKIGPKLHIGHNHPKSCCKNGVCSPCTQSIESDKFERKADKPTLKKVLPISVACGMVSAAAVVAASSLLNTVTKSKSGMVTAMASIVGLGVANTVLMQSFAKGKSKENA